MEARKLQLGGEQLLPRLIEALELESQEQARRPDRKKEFVSAQEKAETTR